VSHSKEKSFLQKGGETPMPLYTIIRVYEVPANNRYEATDELMEAIELKQENVYHVKDVVRAPHEKWGKIIDREPPTKWGTIFKRQLTGKW
jgi:hypothetical protein